MSTVDEMNHAHLTQEQCGWGMELLASARAAMEALRWDFPVEDATEPGLLPAVRIGKNEAGAGVMVRMVEVKPGNYQYSIQYPVYKNGQWVLENLGIYHLEYGLATAVWYLVRDTVREVVEARTAGEPVPMLPSTAPDTTKLVGPVYDIYNAGMKLEVSELGGMNALYCGMMLGASVRLMDALGLELRDQSEAYEGIDPGIVSP